MILLLSPLLCLFVKRKATCIQHTYVTKKTVYNLIWSIRILYHLDLWLLEDQVIYGKTSAYDALFKI